MRATKRRAGRRHEEQVTEGTGFTASRQALSRDPAGSRPGPASSGPSPGAGYPPSVWLAFPDGPRRGGLRQGQQQTQKSSSSCCRKPAGVPGARPGPTSKPRRSRRQSRLCRAGQQRRGGTRDPRWEPRGSTLTLWPQMTAYRSRGQSAGRRSQPLTATSVATAAAVGGRPACVPSEASSVPGDQEISVSPDFVLLSRRSQRRRDTSTQRQGSPKPRDPLPPPPPPGKSKGEGTGQEGQRRDGLFCSWIPLPQSAHLEAYF